VTLLALLALVSPASALELRFWGVGPSLGTMAIPTNYPIGFPANAKSDDTEKYPDGLMVSKVKGDGAISARGVVYPSAAGRVNARVDFGFGKGFGRQEFTVGYDVVAFRDEELQLLFGGGLGAGGETFREINDGPGHLRTSYFPVRANVAGLLRLPPKTAIEVGIYGTFHIVGEQAWFDSPEDTDPELGSEAAKSVFGGGGVAGAVYAALGAEATVYFGDWKPNGDGSKSTKKKRR
jgi:hypothetical protein